MNRTAQHSTAQHDFKKLALALAIAVPFNFAQARTPDANALFNWAEQAYSSFFTGKPTTASYPPYVYRAYGTGNILAVTDDKAYLLGPLSGNQLMPLGSLSQFSCFVYPAECGQTPTVGTGTELQEVNNFFTSINAQWATSLPADATTAEANKDSCYLHNGWTKTLLITDESSNWSAWQHDNTYKIGQKYFNPTILAVRNTSNADGSARKEIDVQYDIAYGDGTTASAVRETIISGSSNGSCSTPQTGTNLRWFGNRQIAGFEVIGINRKSKNLSGNKSTAMTYVTEKVERIVRFSVIDPAGSATYAIIQGAGPSPTVLTPFSIKLVSPRILRSDPLLAGKAGNFTNWLDTSLFRICGDGTSTPTAASGDCVNQISSTQWNWWTTINSSTDLAAADKNFNAFGFGGKYTVALYNDDGWKTVNGHAEKTPIATYTTLEPLQLPYTFVEMNNSGKYPAITQESTITPATSTTNLTVYADGLALMASGNAGQINLQWTNPVAPDGRAYKVSDLIEYFVGSLSTNAAGVTYPMQRWYNYRGNYPGVGSTQANLPIMAKPSTINSKTYFEYDLVFNNRNGRQIELIHTFQLQ